MFRSHLGEEATGQYTMTQVVSDGVIRQLNNSAQALPTNGVQPLATTDATAIPTNPAAPVSYNTIQPLVVMASRGLLDQAPPPEPSFYEKNKPLIIAGGVLLGIFALSRMKPKRR